MKYSVMRCKAIHNLKTALLTSLIILTVPYLLAAQCSVTSSNGWVATFNVTPTSVVPSTTNCQWSYNYDIRFDIRVTFAGSASGRSISGNLYFTCSGGSGGTPYRALGTFTSNTTTSLTTNNNTRGYSAVSSYNYGSNPSCTTINLSHANCTSYRIDYWGSGMSNGSITCNTTTPLPVELLYFDANYSDGAVNFRWATASETNNNYFSLERSTNGVDYDVIKNIPGAGNSSVNNYYTSYDDAPPHGTVYYRLKQTDYNGEFKYSNVFVADIKSAGTVLSVYPNPSHNKLSINYPCNPDNEVNAIVLDRLGRKIKESKISCSNENNPWIDIETLPEGLYILQVNDGLRFSQARFVKN